MHAVVVTAVCVEAAAVGRYQGSCEENGCCEKRKKADQPSDTWLVFLHGRLGGAVNLMGSGVSHESCLREPASVDCRQHSP